MPKSRLRPIALAAFAMLPLVAFDTSFEGECGQAWSDDRGSAQASVHRGRERARIDAVLRSTLPRPVERSRWGRSA